MLSNSTNDPKYRVENSLEKTNIYLGITEKIKTVFNQSRKKP